MKYSHPIQISIPQPCSEDWNKMTPQEQGRFCDNCQKCVVDFTNFSDAELYQYLIENKDKKACGRFRPGQLNRPIQIPHQPHSQLYKWIIAAGLALVISSTPNMKAFARVPFTSTIHYIDTFNLTDKEENKDIDNTNTDSVTIKGFVTDDNKDPLTHAIITVKNGKDTIANTVTNRYGEFSLKLSAIDTTNADIFVNYIGHREYKGPLSSKGTMKIKLEPVIFLMGLIEDIIIEHDPPLMNEYDGGHIKTIKSDEIEKGAY